MCTDVTHPVLLEHLKYSVWVESKTAMSHISLFSSVISQSDGHEHLVKITVFWDGTPCSLIYKSNISEGRIVSIVTLNLGVQVREVRRYLCTKLQGVISSMLTAVGSRRGCVHCAVRTEHVNVIQVSRIRHANSYAGPYLGLWIVRWRLARQRTKTCKTDWNKHVLFLYYCGQFTLVLSYYCNC